MGVRMCEVDFRVPVLGRQCLLTADSLVRIMIIQDVIKLVDSYHQVVRKATHGDLLGMRCKRSDWDNENHVVFQRYDLDGPSVGEIIRQGGYMILD